MTDPVEGSISLEPTRAWALAERLGRISEVAGHAGDTVDVLRSASRATAGFETSAALAELAELLAARIDSEARAGAESAELMREQIHRIVDQDVANADELAAAAGVGPPDAADLPGEAGAGDGDGGR